MPLHIEGVPVDTLLHDIYVNATERAARQDVRLQVEVIAWERLIAAADARWLRHVLLNLVDDAIKSNPGGLVRIQAYPCPDDVRLTIEVRAVRSDHTPFQNAWNVDTLACTVQRMAGDLMTARLPDGSRSAYCHLAQWVPGPADHAFAA